MSTEVKQSSPTHLADFSEYASEFFSPLIRTSPFNRKCNVSLNEDVYLMVRRTLNYLGNGEVSIGGYVENILLNHLTLYRDLLNAETSKRLNDPLIPDSVNK